MIVSFRDLQKKSLANLSTYSIELNNIYQKEIHQNIDILNFVNNKLFANETNVIPSKNLANSEVMGS